MVQVTTSLPVQEAAQWVERGVLDSGVSVELIDRFYQQGEGGALAVLIFDKYFMRNSSRASLTVTISNLTGQTTVRAVGSGGSQGTFFNIDWGAAEDFETAVTKALTGTLL